MKSLAVCIPVHNFAPIELVQTLLSQLAKCEIPYEIFLWDDGSEAFVGYELRKLSHPKLKIFYSQKNEGRSKARNHLVKEAAIYSHLLFLDADAKIEHTDFLKKYLETIRNHPSEIICGGLQPLNDIKVQVLLSWKYDAKRLAQPLEKRKTKPYQFLQTFNFLAPSEIMLQTPFDETLLGYGHEDTLWAWQLKQRGVSVIHIDNPAIHTGVNDNAAFLFKQKEAVNQLIIVSTQNPEIKQQVKLLRWYFRLRKLLSILPTKLIEKLIFNKLIMSNKPRLWLLDFWKLLQLHHQFKKPLSTKSSAI